MSFQGICQALAEEMSFGLFIRETSQARLDALSMEYKDAPCLCYRREMQKEKRNRDYVAPFYGVLSVVTLLAGGVMAIRTYSPRMMTFLRTFSHPAAKAGVTAAAIIGVTLLGGVWGILLAGNLWTTQQMVFGSKTLDKRWELRKADGPSCGILLTLTVMTLGAVLGRALRVVVGRAYIPRMVTFLESVHHPAAKVGVIAGVIAGVSLGGILFIRGVFSTIGRVLKHSKDSLGMDRST